MSALFHQMKALRHRHLPRATIAEDPEIVALRTRLLAGIREKQPTFGVAVLADARTAMVHRGDGKAQVWHRERRKPTKLEMVLYIIGLSWRSEAFFAQVLYRLRIDLKNRGVPIIPQMLNRMAMSSAQLSIGDPVVIHPGVFIAHGLVCIDGVVEIHRGVSIFPWTSIGLVAGNLYGPVIESNARIGTGAKLLGPLHIGANAQVGSNAVVTHDVEANTTVVGVPARPITRRAVDGTENSQ